MVYNCNIPTEVANSSHSIELRSSTPASIPKIVSEINSLLPPADVAFIQQIEQTLCHQVVIPVVNALVSGKFSREVGVVNLIQACLQIFDGAEANLGSSILAAEHFQLSLEKIVLCDKLANSLLSGSLSHDYSNICNVIVPGFQP